MTITLTPEIEHALMVRANQEGTTPEQLALHDLTKLYTSPQEKKRSIMELEGLGAEAWKDEHGSLLDAQEYVNKLRREWDHRP